MAYCILHKDENNLCEQEALYCHDHAVRVGNAELRERVAELERHLGIAKDVIAELSAAEHRFAPRPETGVQNLTTNLTPPFQAGKT